MTTQEAIRDAIVRANKLGAKGVEVVGYVAPDSPTQGPRYLLLARCQCQQQSATDVPWYDR